MLLTSEPASDRRFLCGTGSRECHRIPGITEPQILMVCSIGYENVESTLVRACDIVGNRSNTPWVLDSIGKYKVRGMTHNVRPVTKLLQQPVVPTGNGTVAGSARRLHICNLRLTLHDETTSVGGQWFQDQLGANLCEE